MTKLFDISAEEAIYIDNSESILLKLSNEFSEMNIYFPKDNIQEFKDFITEKTQYIKLGFILGYSVMWKRKTLIFIYWLAMMKALGMSVL